MSEPKAILFKAKELFFKYGIGGALIVELIFTAVFYSLIAAYLPTQNGDNIEHIHSSFLITLGQVPYRDFFQHHNPLLWYMFAPLAKLFAYNTVIAEVACFVSFLFFLKSLVYLYRIVSEFLGDKLWGLAAAAAVSVPGAKLYAVDLRPDNYMVLALMGGIYYYFSYLKAKKSSHLTVAFLWFFIAFMFAQKAIFPLALLGVTGLYFWYKKEITSKDLGKALILPVIGSLSFLFYLYHYGMIKLYYVSNYTFNLNLVAGFEMNRVVDMPKYMVAICCVAWVGVFSALVIKNKYLKVLAFMFVCEFFQRMFYFSPYSYYYWLMIYFGVLCGVPWLYRLNNHNRLVITSVTFVLFYVLIGAANIYYEFYKAGDHKKYLPDFVTRQITPCDYVFNGDGMMYNIFAKDPAYYWQLLGQLDVIGEQTGIHPKPDINALIKKYKPKFVFGKNYFNKFSAESGKRRIVHYVDEDLLNQYYEPTPFYPVYQLKAQYDQRKCRKNLLSGEWSYAY